MRTFNVRIFARNQADGDAQGFKLLEEYYTEAEDETDVAFAAGHDIGNGSDYNYDAATLMIEIRMM